MRNETLNGYQTLGLGRLWRRLTHASQQPPQTDAPVVPDYEKLVQDMMARTKEQARHVIAHPLIPDFVRSRFSPVIDTFRVVSDTEFDQHDGIVSVLEPEIADRVRREGRETTRNYAGARYVYPTSEFPLGHVDFRHGHVMEVLQHEGDDLSFLAAEELSHALHPPVEVIPLTKIKNKAPLAPKGTTVDDVKILMNAQRAEQGILKEVQDGDIDVIRRGFAIEFYDRKTGGLVDSVHHTILEETRAGILATALIALHLGMSASAEQEKPFSAEEEFIVGLNILKVSAAKDPVLMRRESAAVDFIMSYLFSSSRRIVHRSMTTALPISTADIREGITKLFRNFGTMPYNSVAATFSKTEREAFSTATKIIGNDYLENAVRNS